MTDRPTDRTSVIANAFAALHELARYLRSEHGCPWDRAQGLESMHECLREETAELGEDIKKKNFDGITEEWGDVLFILVALAAIAEEEGDFKIEEALRTIETKMIRRHPHVFGNADVCAIEGIIAQWDRIKAREKDRQPVSLLDNLPLFYSALKRADHVQRTAAEVGFDWPDPGGILEKIEEEVGELREALASGDTRAVSGELGDLLFSCVNLARFTGMDSESLLNGTIDKFVGRFKYIESELRRAGKTPADVTLAEMDKLWEASKTANDSSEEQR
jgi:tetrapyrrole methylase family protein/MazG family protein